MVRRAGLLAFFAGVAACQLLAGIDAREVADATSTCGRGAFPARPSTPDGPSDPPLVFAAALTISTAVDDRGLIKGFDLDGVCSDGGAESISCVASPIATKRESDDPEGRDHVVRTLLTEPQLAGLSSRAATVGSRFRMLLEVSDYNGKENDPSVRVAFYQSHGREADGGDVFTTTEDSYFDHVRPKYVIDDAFVKSGVLYGQISDLAYDYPVPLDENGRIRMVLTDVVFGLSFARASVEGVLAGRWATRELLESLSSLPDIFLDASPPERLCGSNATYGNLRKTVCASADIARSRIEDRTGAPCRALSIVFDVEGAAARASTGPRVTATPIAPGCDGGAADECAP